MTALELYFFKTEQEAKLKTISNRFDTAEDAYYKAIDKYEALSDEEYTAHAAEYDAELDRLEERRNDLREAVDALNENIKLLTTLESNMKFLEGLGLA